MKIASFTFDDGFYNTAIKILKINIPATFYLVTDWLKPNAIIEDTFNLNANHGNIQLWNHIKVDIGCHSLKHERNFDEFLCYESFKKIFKKPYNFATPYGIKYKSKHFCSCKIGYYGSPYNNTNIKNLNQLQSINIKHDVNEKELYNIVKKSPNNCWLIFTFHGIEEGWKPVTEEEIINLYDMLTHNHFVIKNISEVVNEICFGSYLL